MGNEGIENDRLVFDYLSRVGDVAQQRQVPAAERRELVSGLRDEIERRREVKGEAVPRILRALGEPDAVVGRVAPARGSVSGPGSAEPEPDAALPVELPRPRAAEPPPGTSAPSSSPPMSVPPPRAAEQAGGGWWREDAMFGARDTGEVPGFVGGIEIADVLKPPPSEDEAEEDRREAPEAPEVAEGQEVPEEAEGGTPERRRAWRGFAPGNLLLLFAAVLLLVGAALGSLIPLAAGWVLAYLSRERKAAALVVPGVVVTAGLVWLWGRAMGRWGEPLAQGAADAQDAGLSTAIGDSWPWILRAAAIASGLFLLWRARRRG